MAEKGRVIISREFRWSTEAKSELLSIIERSTISQQEFSAQARAALDYTTSSGEHPSELKRRQALRAIPLVFVPGYAVYIIFTTEASCFEVLHCALAEKHKAPSISSGVLDFLREAGASYLDEMGRVRITGARGLELIRD